MNRCLLYSRLCLVSGISRIIWNTKRVWEEQGADKNDIYARGNTELNGTEQGAWSCSCRADGFTFRIDNAAYRNGHLYLSIEYKAEREPEDQEEWSRQNAVYQVYMNNLEIKDHVLGPGNDRHSFDTVQFDYEWQQEAELPESFGLEIRLAALENEDFVQSRMVLFCAGPCTKCAFSHLEFCS